MDLSDQDLKSFIETYIKNYTITEISEEGSNRKYYRVSNQNQSLILCITYPFIKEHDDFLELNLYLISKNLRVPKIIDSMPQKGWLLIEDGGSLYLEDIIRSFRKEQRWDEIQNFYQEIIKELIRWHELKDIPLFVKKRYFDLEKFDFEWKFFLERLKRNQLPLPTFEFHSFMQECLDFLTKQKTFVFTHRDFHARNILFQNIQTKNFYVIDYQDARMGLPWYDLSSLLFDPYVELPFSLINGLFFFYYDLRNMPKRKIDHSLHTFYLQAFQRVIKAIGSFLYLGVELNKKHFLSYLLPAINQLINLQKEAKFPDVIYLYLFDLKAKIKQRFSHV
ncbi:MAG: phosphotransferase [Leptospiraceae bacterium]|nr:phosphotransferase [Leptospiraceae bacterium]MDW7976319.1 phosphotransferase [Leptospiraceae bacterium]